jgi:hypothetical protein
MKALCCSLDAALKAPSDHRTPVGIRTAAISSARRRIRSPKSITCGARESATVVTILITCGEDRDATSSGLARYRCCVKAWPGAWHSSRGQMRCRNFFLVRFR